MTEQRVHDYDALAAEKRTLTERIAEINGVLGESSRTYTVSITRLAEDRWTFTASVWGENLVPPWWYKLDEYPSLEEVIEALKRAIDAHQGDLE